MAILISATNNIETVIVYDRNNEVGLKRLQEYVGGFIGVIPAGNGRFLVVDEEGKLKGKSMNKIATLIVRGIISNDDFIVGNAVLLEKGEIS